MKVYFTEKSRTLKHQDFLKVKDLIKEEMRVRLKERYNAVDFLPYSDIDLDVDTDMGLVMVHGCVGSGFYKNITTTITLPLTDAIEMLYIQLDPIDDELSEEELAAIFYKNYYTISKV